MKLAHLTRSEVEAFPEGAVWNAFVELLAMSEPNELDPMQLPAHRAFWYDSEVQNGGHLQYFLNRGLEEAQAAVHDLRQLGGVAFSGLLSEAVSLWQERERATPENAEEYVRLALEGEFERLDAQYHLHSPALTTILEEHLKENQSHFVAIT